MDADILRVAGGIGLFLLGMAQLTDGLRRLAGSALRRLLARFTRSPVSGAVAGAVATAVVQSSSATTVAAVGFVGAGLLTFPQALGVILGANVGSTMTGWLIAVVGFKLELGTVALPLVLAGALLALFGPGRLRPLGWALAGFSLLFIGIDLIQQGIAPLEGALTPADFPPDTLFGRLQLVLIGILITVVTQASSVGVATVLVALATGTITVPLAAAMVIGMDIGTTFKTVIAGLGGSAASRRTGYAHLIYNLLSAVVAFFLLDLYAMAVAAWFSGDAAGDAQIAVVAFHTGFNLLGLVLVLPVIGPFARLVIWLVPERGPALTRRLDDRLLADPGAAADAAAATVRAIADELFSILAAALAPQPWTHAQATRLARVEEALEVTRQFLERLRTAPGDGGASVRHLAAMHALDHLIRLAGRCGQSERIAALQGEPRLRRLAGVLRSLALAEEGGVDLATAEPRLDRLRRMLRRQREGYRARTLLAAAQHRVDAETALLRLDGIRWLHRVSYHLWRIAHHLARAEQQAPPGAAPEPEEPED